MKRCGAVLVLAFLIGGCAHTGSVDDKGKMPLPAAKTPSAVFVLNECPSGEKGRLESGIVPLISILGSVGSAVVPPLLDYGAERIADYFDQRARDLNASSTAKTTSDLYSIESAKASGISDVRSTVTPYAKCLVFIRGQFGDGDPVIDPNRPFWSKVGMEKVNSALRRSGRSINLLSAPEVYAEFVFDYRTVPVPKQDIEPVECGKGNQGCGDGDKKHIEETKVYSEVGLRPVRVDYAKVGAKRNPDHEKQLVFSVTIDSLSHRNKDGKPVTISETTFDLGEVKEGALLTAAALDFKGTDYFALPAPGVMEITLPGGKRDYKAYAIDRIPTRFTVSLSETEEGGDLERALADHIRAAAKEKKFSKPVDDYIKEVVDEEIKKRSAKPETAEK